MMADEKKNNENGDQTGENLSDYEELLNGFSDGDESGEGQDGIALSELLDGIETQDESGEEADGKEEEVNEFDLDALEDLNIDDFSEDSSEAEEPEESAKVTDSGTFDIDVDEDGGDDLGGYSSLLSELDKENPEEPAGQNEEPGKDEPVTQEIPVLEDVEDSGELGGEKEGVPEIESLDELTGQEESHDTLIDEETPEESAESSGPAAQEVPAIEDIEPSEEIDVSYAEEGVTDSETGEPAAGEIGEEDETPGETSDIYDVDEHVLDEVDYTFDTASEDKDVPDVSAEEELEGVDSEVSYAEMLNEENTGDFDNLEEDAGEDEDSYAELTSETDIEELDIEESTADNGETVSYASMLDDTRDTDSQAGEHEEIQERETIESIDDGEFSLDELASEDDDAGELSFGEELHADADAGEESAFDDFLSPSDSEEEEFVISGADDANDEEDFLQIHEEESEDARGEDDLIPGIADVSSTLAAEASFDGFEMDAEEQIRAVTRAELLLAQGKTSEAADVFSQIVESQGITPWVAKRCAELGVKVPGNAVESESEETA